MRQERVVYDCLDHHVGFHTDPNPRLTEVEQQLIDAADAVVATSETLASAIRKTRECHLIRNACEYTRFNQEERLKTSSRPIIGYVGAVSEWFDGQLLFDLAKVCPEWQFDIYGAIVGVDVAACRALHNVNFFGEISYESVPSVIAHFDVCIIPFKLNALTLATNPVKVYEYLASGRPVVSSPLPELAGLETYDVFCASTTYEFIKCIGKALKISQDAARINVRQHFAAQNDWSNRGEAFLQLLK